MDSAQKGAVEEKERDREETSVKEEVKEKPGESNSKDLEEKDEGKKEDNTCFISFVMLYDLHPVDSPIYRKIPRTKEEIKKFVMEIANSYKPCFTEDGVRNKYDKLGCIVKDSEYKGREKRREEWDAKYKDKKLDPSNFFSGYVLEYQEDPPFNESNADSLADTLLEDGYFVRNRLEKYYVVAFALDFATFSVYSKDCDPKVIDWRKKAEPPSGVEREDEFDDPSVTRDERSEVQIKNGEFKGEKLGPDDNINPVVSTVKKLLGES